jgi:alpha-D-ribose 1-methylphosphonate 5-triphosphate synthase subunit PhnG
VVIVTAAAGVTAGSFFFNELTAKRATIRLPFFICVRPAGRRPRR